MLTWIAIRKLAALCHRTLKKIKGILLINNIITLLFNAYHKRNVYLLCDVIDNNCSCSSAVIHRRQSSVLTAFHMHQQQQSCNKALYNCVKKDTHG